MFRSLFNTDTQSSEVIKRRTHWKNQNQGFSHETVQSCSEGAQAFILLVSSERFWDSMQALMTLFFFRSKPWFAERLCLSQTSCRGEILSSYGQEVFFFFRSQSLESEMSLARQCPKRNVSASKRPVFRRIASMPIRRQDPAELTAKHPRPTSKYPPNTIAKSYQKLEGIPKLLKKHIEIITKP